MSEAARRAKKNWKLRNRDKVRAYDREYKKSDKALAWAARWRDENREKLNARARKYRDADPEKYRDRWRQWASINPNRIKHNSRSWSERNREYKIAKLKAWRKANPDRVKENRERWEKENRDKRRIYVKARAARRRGAAGLYTADDINRIHEAQRGCCAYCRIELGQKYSIDHIIPLVAGGTNEPRNLQLTCKSCNSRKHIKDPLDFARELGMLL